MSKMKNDCKMTSIKPIPIVEAHPGIARLVYNLNDTTTAIPKIESKINIPKKTSSRTDTTSRYTEIELIP